MCAAVAEITWISASSYRDNMKLIIFVNTLQFSFKDRVYKGSQWEANEFIER